MIWPSPLAADVDRRDRKRARRKRTFRIAVAVIAGIFVSGWLHSPAPTPTNVARAYVEAKITGDWSRAWALTCTTVHSAVDYATFADRAEYANRYYAMPSDVDVEIEGLRGIRGPSGPSAEVAIAMTSDEPNRGSWVYRAEMLLVQEPAGFRVCTKDADET